MAPRDMRVAIRRGGACPGSIDGSPPTNIDPHQEFQIRVSYYGGSGSVHAISLTASLSKRTLQLQETIRRERITFAQWSPNKEYLITVSSPGQAATYMQCRSNNTMTVRWSVRIVNKCVYRICMSRCAKHFLVAQALTRTRYNTEDTPTEIFIYDVGKIQKPRACRSNHRVTITRTGLPWEIFERVKVMWHISGKSFLMMDVNKVCMYTYKKAEVGQRSHVTCTQLPHVFPKELSILRFVTVSPDKRYICYNGYGGNHAHMSYYTGIYDTKATDTAALYTSIPGIANAKYITWSPSGKMVAVLDNSHYVTILAYPSLQIYGRIEVDRVLGLFDANEILIWSNDGTYIYARPFVYEVHTRNDRVFVKLCFRIPVDTSCSFPFQWSRNRDFFVHENALYPPHHEHAAYKYSICSLQWSPNNAHMMIGSYRDKAFAIICGVTTATEERKVVLTTELANIIVEFFWASALSKMPLGKKIVNLALGNSFPFSHV